ncbi:MAG: hypothetical protein B7Z60_02420 [Ferrovum sp. 37-45-19]|nr:MAG: hypothetical protein B7Z65_01925 [Ferrovum sp. 21-44-67]OYV95065.1 MAG: hypothetical protein B7Z60_02420 [Ferrovum sp. 37-45-19]HQT80874.1 NAD(P)/FAD-dependent oxidoreductase [Ferrovaceae bacterium]HQU06614.1 NAD(P)/FAD-dependent oxidoreductase [Ferrovaceae bacterium]
MYHKYNVIIVGAGFSGLSMGLELYESHETDWMILEQASEVGGTWRENTYPGSGSDVPSILYQLKQRPYLQWSHKYAGQKEILCYLKSLAEPIKDKIKLSEKVISIEFINKASHWLITTNKGTWITRFLIMSMSPLAEPHIPVIQGREDFTGPQFHTSQWPENLNYKDKKVAIIGSGASAIQCIETIQPHVNHLTIFQRSASWVMSKKNQPILHNSRFFTNKLLFNFFYLFNYCIQEIKVLFFINPVLMKLLELIQKRRIASLIHNPELRSKITPNYPLGCKRIVLSDHYYQVVSSSNVSVHTSAIQQLTKTGITLVDGTYIEADMIIYATGFIHDQHIPIQKITANGLQLKDVWNLKRSAYLGIFVKHFPNLFLLVGPNTGLGHQSLVFMIERQTRYLNKFIKYLLKQKVKEVSVKPHKQELYQQMIEVRNPGTVWQKGCHSWYVNGKGENVALWPFSSLYYWWLTKDYNKNDFEIRL